MSLVRSKPSLSKDPNHHPPKTNSLATTCIPKYRVLSHGLIMLGLLYPWFHTWLCSRVQALHPFVKLIPPMPFWIWVDSIECSFSHKFIFSAPSPSINPFFGLLDTQWRFETDIVWPFHVHSPYFWLTHHFNYKAHPSFSRTNSSNKN